MGYINEFEQQQLLLVYGKLSQYRCNHCKQPIFIDELMVGDQKGGIVKVNVGSVANPCFKRFDKVTYHRRCSDILLGRAPGQYKPIPFLEKKDIPAAPKRDSSTRQLQLVDQKLYQRLRKIILHLMKHRSRDYWTKTKLLKLMRKRDKKLFNIVRPTLRAMVESKTLRKHGDTYNLLKKK